MMPASTAKLTPAQLQKWIDERAAAIVEVWRSAQWSEAVGMLRSDNFGLSPVLTALVCAQLDVGHVADLAEAMAQSAKREHRLLRDLQKSRKGAE